jgi:mevalonate kinase
VGEIKRQHPVKVNKWFREITEIVNLAEKKINKGDWEEVGELMNKNQLVLQKLQVSSVELDRLIEACLKAGAYGAKLSGAGGGDCMIAVTSEEKRKGVEKAIVQAGGEVLRVNLGAVGARIER